MKKKRKRRKHASVVYLITDGEFTKIGTTTNIEQRLSAIQTGNPKPCKVILTVPGDKRLEEKLHEAFKHREGQGEWFRLTEDDIARIATLKPAPTPQPPEPPPPPAEKEMLTYAFIEELANRWGGETLDVFYALPESSGSPWVIGPGEKLVLNYGPAHNFWTVDGLDRRKGDPRVGEVGWSRTITALSQTTRLQEQLEILLQAALRDAMRCSRRTPKLERLRQFLAERRGELLVARDPSRASWGMSLIQQGSLGNSQIRSFLPYVEMWELVVSKGMGYPSDSVILEGVRLAYREIGKRYFLVANDELEEFPYEEMDLNRGARA